MSRYILLGTANTNANTIAVTYWDGDSWATVEDLIDQTSGFTTSGFISWQNESDWTAKALTPITDVELYWIKIVPGATLSAGTTIQAVLNLFCDDNLLRSYYPELVSDTRYLPPSRNDFMEQFVEAKNMIVNELRKDSLIQDESQILDINDVAMAAVHAAAWLIMNPIARGDDDRERVKDAWNNMVMALNKVPNMLDLNNDGTVDDSEKDAGFVFRMRG